MSTDLSIAEADPAPTPVRSSFWRSHEFTTISNLVVRWVFLALVTLIAFHRSVDSVVQGTLDGGVIGFVWLLPPAAAIAAASVTRRKRVELPIHDRQTDIIVGILGLALALMVQRILLLRYSEYFDLLRIDLIAMVIFVWSSSVIIFGLRPVIRFQWVWVMLLMVFPLAYQLSVISFGGNRTAAGAASLVIAAVATAVSVGRTFSRALVGAAVAIFTGAVVLIGMVLFTPNAGLLAFQMIPALAAMSLAGVGLFAYARRGLSKRMLDRKIEPLASRQIWAGIPLVLLAAAMIFVGKLPPPAATPTWVPGFAFARPLASPPGWHQTQETDYAWVRRLYGSDATLIRQTFVADTGKPEWDTKNRPRVVVVDSTTTAKPFSLRVYPPTLLFNETQSRFSDPVPVDLGQGITGSLVTVVNDRTILTYNQLTWSWQNETGAQRVSVMSVDNHDEDAEFTEPLGGLGSTLQRMFNVFFRGNQATWDSDPTFKDLEMLTEFGSALVDAQFRQVPQ